MTSLCRACLLAVMSVALVTLATAQTSRPVTPPPTRPAPPVTVAPAVPVPPSTRPVPSTPAVPNAASRVAPPAPGVPPAIATPELRRTLPLTTESTGSPNRVAHLQAAQQAGALIAVLRQRGLTAKVTVLSFLGGALVSFSVPGDVNETELLGDLPDLFPGLLIAPNDRLAPADATDADDPRGYGRRLVGWPSHLARCARNARLGMVDTGIDLGHPAFAGHAISQRWLVRESGDPTLLRHGTAIAGLLVGNAPIQAIEGLAPGGVLLSAAVFDLDGDGTPSASVENTVIAIDWLGSENVDVINLSIAGPSNAVLERGIALAGRTGLPMVAAAGNEGSNGSRAYPAASPEVLAVTALDQRLKPYRHATHGAYIDVAAPGVDIWTAAMNGGGAYRSGTSIATPFVAVMVGALRVANPAANAEAIYAALRTAAEDLGSKGHDSVFGWGLAHMPDAVDCGEPATDDP